MDYPQIKNKKRGQHMMITNSIYYVGVNDHELDLFEGQYLVPNGMAYNSYIVMDEQIAVMDSVDANFTDAWLQNIRNTLGERAPDYLVVQHMEPDHSGSILRFTMLGLGIYLPAYLSFTAGLGGLLRLIVSKAAPEFDKGTTGTVIASGLLAGEGFIGVVIALIQACQILAAG